MDYEHIPTPTWRGWHLYCWNACIKKSNSENFHWGVRRIGEGSVTPLVKQKLYIDWIFLCQSKILNFAMIGFYQISLSTFIRNFALYCNVKKFEKFSFRSFQSRTFKNNRVIATNINDILKPVFTTICSKDIVSTG